MNLVFSRREQKATDSSLGGGIGNLDVGCQRQRRNSLVQASTTVMDRERGKPQGRWPMSRDLEERREVSTGGRSGAFGSARPGAVVGAVPGWPQAMAGPRSGGGGRDFAGGAAGGWGTADNGVNAQDDGGGGEPWARWWRVLSAAGSDWRRPAARIGGA
jgi:hypothetical protein